MKIPRIVDSRLGFMSAAFFILASVVAPVALTTSASAEVLIDRSMMLSSSAAGAVANYELTFTPEANAGAMVIDFCSDSPIIGQTCTTPTGFDITGATSSPSGVTTPNGDYTLQLATAMTAGTPITVTFSGITNPSSPTTLDTGFFARIHTYADGSTATSQHTAPNAPGDPIDEGGIAMAITNPIQVSAAVRETMTFCVSKLAPGVGCGDSGQAVTAPTLSLGHGTPEALDASATDTGTVFSQISTNALNGAIVRMKINNTCGGLQRQGDTDCDIPPVATGTDAILAGTAKFGMRISDVAEAAVGEGEGTLEAATNYGHASNYGMNWVSGNASGVGGPYGDPIFDSGEAPVMNMNATMTFAATASNTTPAGLYEADLNLVATGTF